MKKIDAILPFILKKAGGGSAASAKASFAAYLEKAFKKAVQDVYKTNAQFILDHINGVYVLQKGAPVRGRDGKKQIAEKNTLVIYVGDSVIKADLDARQEFLKLELKEKNIEVEQFLLLSPRYTMRERKPFSQHIQQKENNNRKKIKPFKKPLSKGQQNYIEACCCQIENKEVKNALKKALEKSLSTQQEEV